jgi:hypothetical protein
MGEVEFSPILINYQIGDSHTKSNYMNRILNRAISFLGKIAISFFLMVLPGSVFAAWESITPSGASNDFSAVVTAGGFVYLATDSGVYGSTDSGSSWDLGTGLGTNPYTSLAIAWYFDDVEGYVADESTPVYLATGNGLYESTLGSNSWNTTTLTDVMVHDVEVDQFGGPTTLYAATANGVYRSDDAGTTWILVNTGLEGETVIGLTSDFAYGVLYATTVSGEVYRSNLYSAFGEDETWSQVYDGDVNDVSLLNAVGGITWLATSNGILKDDGSGNYEVVSIGLPDGGVHTVASDFADPNIAYAAHATGGIYRTTSEAIVADGSYDAQWLPFNINLSAQSIVSVVTDPINPLVVYALGEDNLYKIELLDQYDDVVAPGAITNLSVREFTDTTVTLLWTRPGGDGDFGIPASYDVRYSTEVIETEEDWEEATEAVGEPTPYSANTEEVFMVQPLPSNTRHYFAVRALDDAGNRGPLSNVVEAGNILPPSDSTAPIVTTFSVPSTSNSLIVPIDSFTATDTVGVSGFIVTLSSTSPSVDNPEWTANTPANVTFPGEGTHTAYAWARDEAGNVSESEMATVTITLPETNIDTPRRSGGGGGGGSRRNNDTPTETVLAVASLTDDMTEGELKIHLQKQIIALLTQLIALLQQKL